MLKQIAVTGQLMICDFPLRLDTYGGCTHKCAYCFSSRKDLQRNKKVISIFSENGIRNVINKGKNQDTGWIDWDLPFHWGGQSDPFQPVEKHYRHSKRTLEIFAETQYPFIVSTKGKLIAEPEYLELIKKCNCAVQISMLCSEYDSLETGAPTFEERLIMLEKVSKAAKRTLVRCQPYLPQFLESVKKNIPRFKAAGAYGVIFEGMKFVRKQQGLIKLGNDYVFPVEKLRAHFEILKSECHKNGLKFFSGENRLRAMGDSLCCCGVAGLDGFRPNTFNANHILLGNDATRTPAMGNIGSGWNLMHHLHQRAGLEAYHKLTFEQLILKELRDNKESLQKVLGVKK